jgi:hypothetical protein
VADDTGGTIWKVGPADTAQTGSTKADDKAGDKAKRE